MSRWRNRWPAPRAHFVGEGRPSSRSRCGVHRSSVFYAAISAELGERFHAEIKRLIGEVSAHPKTFRQFDPPARRHFSLRFPYAIIYLEQDDRLWIVAVMNLKRNPDYWKTRIV